jgi:hypothetical protein
VSAFYDGIYGSRRRGSSYARRAEPRLERYANSGGDPTATGQVIWRRGITT